MAQVAIIDVRSVEIGKAAPVFESQGWAVLPVSEITTKSCL